MRILGKIWIFAQWCECTFEVGRQSRVGVLEVLFDICKTFLHFFSLFHYVKGHLPLFLSAEACTMVVVLALSLYSPNVLIR